MTDMETDTRTTGTRGEHPTGGGHSTVRWSAAWVGALTAVPVFLVLQLLVVAFGWITPGSDGDTNGGIVSAVLGVIALAVGGAASGAAGSRSPSSTALLEGAAVWALAVVGLIALGVAGAGAILGAAGGLTGVVVDTTPPVDPATAADAVRSGAGWAAVWLGVSFLAAVGGAAATRDRVHGRTDARR
ncbi:hypothetical protein [Actinomycetospora sp. NBRC 106378]|uniref:hypothetical protein n=1 Tax=Actinomycetospora sp. NBRC 106378 TaxID=3032208 RepID=UPI0024A5F21F|nr:hypothetical protein [Actinomycetospora sp. NBRC 106378]GLZ55725.1 hypothetical protein Acsp07_53420 [Actinomycetospora sp. NBRC 106378]